MLTAIYGFYILHAVGDALDVPRGQRNGYVQEVYQSLEGRYDKLVSIEMIEAVGLDYLPQFFEVCASLLKPGGSMLLQAITIAEEHRLCHCKAIFSAEARQ